MLWNDDIQLWGETYDDKDAEGDEIDEKDNDKEQEGDSDTDNEKDNKGEGKPSENEDNEPETDNIDDEKSESEDDENNSEDDDEQEGEGDEDEVDSDLEDTESPLAKVDLGKMTSTVDDEAINAKLESMGIPVEKATPNERKLAKSALHSQRAMTEKSMEASDTKKEIDSLKVQIEEMKKGKTEKSTDTDTKSKAKEDSIDDELTEADALQLWDDGKQDEAKALLEKIRQRDSDSLRNEFRAELDTIKNERAEREKERVEQEAYQNNVSVTHDYMKKTLANSLRSSGRVKLAAKVESQDYQLSDAEQGAVLDRTKQIYDHAVKLFNLQTNDKLTARHFELAEIDLDPESYKKSIRQKERATISQARSKAKSQKGVSKFSRKGRSNKGSKIKLDIQDNKTSGAYADEASQLSMAEIDAMIEEMGI